jgi:hypothetical protein
MGASGSTLKAEMSELNVVVLANQSDVKWISDHLYTNVQSNLKVIASDWTYLVTSDAWTSASDIKVSISDMVAILSNNLQY